MHPRPGHEHGSCCLNVKKMLFSVLKNKSILHAFTKKIETGFKLKHMSSLLFVFVVYSLNFVILAYSFMLWSLGDTNLYNAILFFVFYLFLYQHSMCFVRIGFEYFANTVFVFSQCNLFRTSVTHTEDLGFIFKFRIKT